MLQAGEQRRVQKARDKALVGALIFKVMKIYYDLQSFSLNEIDNEARAKE